MIISFQNIVGLQSGVLFRTIGDMVTRQLSNGRSRFLGLGAPKVLSVLARGRQAMICLASRPWLGYVHQGHLRLTPVSYETHEYAAFFELIKVLKGAFSAKLRESAKKECFEAAWKMEIEIDGDDDDTLFDPNQINVG
ncbi:spliceosome-associated protein 130 A [Tanacetum coccineum]